MSIEHEYTDEPVQPLADDQEDSGTEVEITSEANEVEIEVVDDTPEKDRGRKPLDREVSEPTDEELAAYSGKVQSRIKELTHARHDERRKREALERERLELQRIAQAVLEENKRLKQYVHTGEENFVSVASTAVEFELDAARKRLRAAHEAFDTDGIVAAQEALAEAKMKADRVRSFKPTPLQDSEYDVQLRQYENPQPVQQQLTDRDLRWQARNRWFQADGFEEVTSYALGLHQKLVTSGVEPASEEYYETIDSRIREKFPEVFGEPAKTRQEVSRKPASVVAPATRASGVKKVQLTQTQVALARRLGITPQQYAAELAKLEK